MTRYKRLPVERYILLLLVVEVYIVSQGQELFSNVTLPDFQGCVRLG